SHHAAGCVSSRRHEWGRLLVGPQFLRCSHVVCPELPDLAVSARHLVKPPAGAVAAAATVLLLDFLRAHFEATLAEWNDALICGEVVCGSGPVVAAFGARATLYPQSEFLFRDVLPIFRLAGLRIEAGPDVLKDSFLVTEILARLPVELPQDAILPDREDQVLVSVVNEYA